MATLFDDRMQLCQAGKGQALYRTKLRNLLRGNVLETNVQVGR